MAGNYEVVGSSNSKNLDSLVASIQAILSSTHHTMYPNPCPVQPASRVVIPHQLSACTGKMGTFIDAQISDRLKKENLDCCTFWLLCC